MNSVNKKNKERKLEDNEPSILYYKIQVSDNFHEINDRKFYKIANYFDEDLDKKSFLKNNNGLSCDLEENDFFIRETGKNLKIIEDKIAKINENSNLSTSSSLKNNEPNDTIRLNTDKNIKSNKEMNLIDYNEKLVSLIKELKKKDKIISHLSKEKKALIKLIDKKDKKMSDLLAKDDDLIIFNEKVLKENESLTAEKNILNKELDKYINLVKVLNQCCESNQKEITSLDIKLKEYIKDYSCLSLYVKNLNITNEKNLSRIEDYKSELNIIYKESSECKRNGKRNLYKKENNEKNKYISKSMDKIESSNINRKNVVLF